MASTVIRIRQTPSQKIRSSSRVFVTHSVQHFVRVEEKIRSSELLKMFHSIPDWRRAKSDFSGLIYIYIVMGV